MADPKTIELNSHDVSRVWELAINLYDDDDDDSDLRDYFVTALQMYHQFMAELTSGDMPQLNAHDMTRVWSLMVRTWDEDDLRTCFDEALESYREFMTDLEEGGTTFDANDRVYVSARDTTPDGDLVRFAPTPEGE